MMAARGRISARLRGEAILICEVQASTPDLAGNSSLTAEALGIRSRAPSLAREAMWQASERMHAALLVPTVAEEYAAGAALLRDGDEPEGWDLP